MRRNEYFLIAAFVAVFLLTHLPRLATGSGSSDALLWHKRAEAFVTALKAHDFAKTYQKYHPGVTLMWILGAAFEFSRDTFYNFEVYDYAAKIFLVFKQLGLSLVSLYLLSKILDFKKAFLIVLLLSIEPFFLANSRLLHLDVLFTLCLFNGLLLAHLAMKKLNIAEAIFAGIFLSAAFLTKSVGILGIGFVLIWGIFSRKFRALGILTAAFFLTTFLIFPALWVAPVQTFSKMVVESREVAFDKGHTQLFFGKETDNPGPLFYPLVLLIKLSPAFLLGPILFYVTKKSRQPEILTFLNLFYFLYFVAMVLAPKKLDRYMLPIFPLFAVWLTLGISQLSKKYLPLIIFAVFAFQVLPIFTLFPHYFAYSSPIVGSARNANKIIGQKSFGTGIYDLRERLMERYPDKTVAISDVGPLKEIYGSFRVFDIWKADPKSYDLLILGPNVELPEFNGRNFKQIDSLWIGGLE